MAFASTGRDFEIAIAGPLVEVPVMLALVWGAMRFRARLFGETPSIAITAQQVAPKLSPR